MTTNTARFAQRELSILSKLATDPEDRPLIEPFIPEILALCERFGNSGQSGGSAPYTAGALSQAIKKLLLQEPICPIAGIDEEWVDVAHLGDGSGIMFQNARCSGLFKNSKDVPAWYLDAIVWKTQTGNTWSGTAFMPNERIVGETGQEHFMPSLKKVGSRQYVKSFPFTPKTFYVDVIEKEVKKDDWEFYIKNQHQLDVVFKYYDRLPV